MGLSIARWWHVLGLVAAMTTALGACTGSGEPAVTPPRSTIDGSPARTLRDLVYADKSPLQVLDLYLPARPPR